ncbi:MAG: trypsin-like serine protease [Holophagales bacterium]|nr:trypsin-like serine protease [Holophagales bacterium]MYG29969.1 trypsin-like serine protease [Holophagales bacterium]MYI78648.1 trypsin-like serine protease [Holophagales bacterium]
MPREVPTGSASRQRPRFAAVSGLFVLAVLAFVFGSRWQGSVLQADSRSESRQVAPASGLLPEERTTVNLFRQASPSVVNITSVTNRRNVFARRIDRVPEGTGTGFIWDTKGHVVTNFHVVLRGHERLVTLSDQTTWPAEFVGGDPHVDLAVLKIDAPADKLRPIAIGTSRDLQVGQSVMAIGNPFGLDHTLTTGVISALDREVSSLTNRLIRGVIQTDAAINPGNSGGPLLDSSGRLIGVNTQIVSSSGSWGGIGFAIPVDTVNWVVPELVAHGEVERPLIGVELDDSLLRARGVKGALVTNVVSGSGADKAGMRASRRTRRGIVLGDLITAIEGREVASVNDVHTIVEDFRVGDVITVTVVRRDGEEDLEVRLTSSR